MFEYVQLSQSTLSRVAAERYAQLSAAAAAKAEGKRVRVARRSRATVTKAA